MNKTIWIFGRRFEVTGSDIDDYYQGLRHGVELDHHDSVLAGIRPFVATDAVCLDVGANIGLYTLALAAMAPEGSVWAFEPGPSTFEFLSRNVEINSLLNAHPVNAAVSDVTGTVEFQDIPFFTAGSFTVVGEPFLTTEVLGSLCIKSPSITIDQFMADQGLDRLDFVKVDVEGGEMAVLDGAVKTLAEHRPVVVLEFNSFGMSFHNAVLPQRALARILDTFPHVYVMDRTDGSLSCLQTPKEAYELLYENGIHGPADNLLCSFEDLSIETALRPAGVTGLGDRPRRAGGGHAEHAVVAGHRPPAPGPRAGRPQPRRPRSRWTGCEPPSSAKVVGRPTCGELGRARARSHGARARPRKRSTRSG